MHLLIDVWDGVGLDDPIRIKALLKDMAISCGATLLGIKVHSFGVKLGVTGVAYLAESHISIHSWPEYGYAAIDIFVCGKANPYNAISLLHLVFKTENISIIEHKRGTISENMMVIRQARTQPS